MDQYALAQLTQDFAQQGIAIVEGLFSEELLDGLSEQIHRLRAQEFMRPALIGRGSERKQRPEIRGDSIYWLPSPPIEVIDRVDTSNRIDVDLTWAELVFYQEIESLITHFNRSFFMGLRGCEFHYAQYESGAGYERHRDRFKGSEERIISMITYLNRTWRSGDGGELKVFLPKGSENESSATDESFLLISPRWGYTVCFESDRFDHEVLPAYAPRQSITGWLRR